MSAAVAGAFLGPALGAARRALRHRPGLRDRRRRMRGAGGSVVSLSEPGVESRSGTMAGALGIRSLRVPLGLILLAPLLFAVLGVLVPLSLGASGWGARTTGRALRGGGRAGGRRAPAARPLGGSPGRARPDLRRAGRGDRGARGAGRDGRPVAGGRPRHGGGRLRSAPRSSPGWRSSREPPTRPASTASSRSPSPTSPGRSGTRSASPLCGWLADRAGDTLTYLAFAALCVGVLAALRSPRLAHATRPS